jgi:hypothetical protein
VARAPGCIPVEPGPRPRAGPDAAGFQGPCCHCRGVGESCRPPGSDHCRPPPYSTPVPSATGAVNGGCRSAAGRRHESQQGHAGTSTPTRQVRRHVQSPSATVLLITEIHGVESYGCVGLVGRHIVAATMTPQAEVSAPRTRAPVHDAWVSHNHALDGLSALPPGQHARRRFPRRGPQRYDRRQLLRLLRSESREPSGLRSGVGALTATLVG